MLLLWAGVGIAAVVAWLLFRYRKKTPRTLADRTELRKRTITEELIAEWENFRSLGSTETIGDWLKRKLPVLDDDWLAKNGHKASDRALIAGALQYVLTKPQFIEWLIETDSERQASQVAE